MIFCEFCHALLGALPVEVTTTPAWNFFGRMLMAILAEIDWPLILQ
jgi:hypothetical protein